MLKYRIKHVNDDWLLFVPLIGLIAMFFGMLFGNFNNTYKIQKRFLFFFWKDIETVYGEKEAIYKCNELNGEHNHTSKFVYLWDKKYDLKINGFIPKENKNKTIIKVEYCSECGEIISKKIAKSGAYKSSYTAIKEFKDICKITDIDDITIANNS